MVLFNDFSIMAILNIAGILNFLFLHFVGMDMVGSSFLNNTPLEAIGKGLSPGLGRGDLKGSTFVDKNEKGFYNDVIRRIQLKTLCDTDE
jgi:hypothetical protein